MDFTLCGWRVRSVFPLPEAAEWSGPDGPVDIEICPGSMPAEVGKQSADLPYLEMLGDGSLIFDAMPHARFLVSASRVVIDLPYGPEATTWRPLLLGPILALLCYIRGLVPLHASVVRIGGRAVAFAGRSGAGKSTLAAALCARGHALVTDDVCPVSHLSTVALVHPTFPGMKLSTPTLAALGVGPCDFLPVLPDGDKMQVPQPKGFEATPLPLDLVYLIEDAPEGASDRIETITGAEAFERLSADIYRPQMGRFLSGRSALFSKIAQLAGHAAVRRIIRRRAHSKLAALARLIEADANRPRQSGEISELTVAKN